ncbi:DUF6491 family protein [Ferrimonas marina]|uniref:Uncharacterized protein n=1 Tax=Ferrimonas marina TaxID=299255 RepID=A0A1M5VDV8_9GAMM|nr:DUF6491 family protein [Ferrimonas marina]SHH73396.1 hypothetical protein SAMN02745129_2728 [Ferrimonas marina]
MAWRQSGFSISSRPVLVWGLLLAWGLVLAGCSSEPYVEDPKYSFSELEQVQRIENYRMNSWEALDNQAVLIQQSPRTWYLLILQRPDPNLTFANVVLVSSTVGSVEARFDTVSTPLERGRKTHIERIYKVDGKEQYQAVKAQIANGVEALAQDDTQSDEGSMPQ